MTDIPEHLRRRAEKARARTTEQVPCPGSGHDGHYQGQGRVMCATCGALLGMEHIDSRRVVDHSHWTVEHLLNGGA